MFEKLCQAINLNIEMFFVNGYYKKEFVNEKISDKFYILLNKKYTVEIVVNYMDDNITFFLLRMLKDEQIEGERGYYKYDNGEWKREFLDIVCLQLNIEFDVELLKRLGQLDYRHNKNKEVIVERVNKHFEAFAFFFREYKKYLPEFDTLK